MTVEQDGNYKFKYIEETRKPNDGSISQNAYVKSAVVTEIGSVNKPNVAHDGTRKIAVVVHKQSHIAIRVAQR